jgi:hypothetical protein
MSGVIKVQTEARVNRDDASPALQRIADSAAGRKAIHQYMADAARVLIQGHFRTLAAERHNRFGLPSRFWARMYRGTRSAASADRGEVRMPREVALRYFGGTLRPTGGRKALTIPMVAQAYRKRAREIRDLFLIRSKTGDGRTYGVLARQEKGKDAPTPYYLLVRSATVKPDKSVLPSDRAIYGAAMQGNDRWWRSMLRQHGGDWRSA